MPARPAMSEFPLFVDFLLAGILSNILFTLAFQLLKYYMKCPCCNENFSSATDLKKHYVDFHTVDKSNYIFRKLLTRCRAFFPKNVFVAKNFYLIEERKIISYAYSDLQKYCITFSKHGDYYNYSKKSTSEFSS